MRHLALLQTVLFLCVIGITGLIAGTDSATTFARPVDSDPLTGKLAKNYEAHYDDVFPAKRLSVNVWAAISLVVFDEGRPGVELGKDDWLYTSEEFNVADGAAANLADNLALIAWVKPQLAERKIELLVAVVPAKARVYPEYIGKHKPAQLQHDLHDRLIAALAEQGIPTADLLPALIEGKSEAPTFFRTDTHWTPWGAQLAAKQITNLASERGFARTATDRMRFVTTLQPEKPHRGDLFNYLPLDPYFSALLPPVDLIRVPQTAAADAAASTSADLFGNDAVPQVALVGSSYSANPLWNFAGALKETLGEDVVDLAKEGVGPFPPMIQYLLGTEIKDAPPRLVIWEIPERSLLVKPDLSAFKLPTAAHASVKS